MPSPSSADSTLAPGSSFAGKFVIQRLLGQGGMGAVYLALHEGLRQRFAIKVLLGDVLANPEAVRRFMNEASAAAAIQSEHVARVTDVARTEDGAPYMVMEYLEGSDLAELLAAHGALPVSDAVNFVLQAIDGVHQAHAAQIVHRDLKPANLFLAKRADGSQVIKVLDFGISKMQNALEDKGALTTTRAMLGSPLYMSPEQLRSSKNVDARTDVWALGVILYELLTGSVPYTGESLGELFANILETDPIPPRQHDASIPAELEAVLMHCLRKKKEERFQTAAELARALLPFATQSTPLLARISSGQFPQLGGTAAAPGTITSIPQSHLPQSHLPQAQTGSGQVNWATGSMNGEQAGKKRGGGVLLGGLAALALVVGGTLVFLAKGPASALGREGASVDPSTLAAEAPQPSSMTPTTTAEVSPPAQSTDAGAAPEPSQVTAPTPPPAPAEPVRIAPARKPTSSPKAASKPAATVAPATSAASKPSAPAKPAADPFGIGDRRGGQ